MWTKLYNDGYPEDEQQEDPPKFVYVEESPGVWNWERESDLV